MLASPLYCSVSLSSYISHFSLVCNLMDEFSEVPRLKLSEVVYNNRVASIVYNVVFIDLSATKKKKKLVF